LKLKLPAASVVVPRVVPFIEMETPGTPSSFSSTYPARNRLLGEGSTAHENREAEGL
jgi:hypothetical protein